MIGFFRNRRLNKDASRMRTKFLPIGEIRTVTALIDASAEGVSECTAALEEFCESHEMKLSYMYVDLRRFSKKVQPTTDLEKTITRKDLNWFGKPSKEKMAGFTPKRVDLFICLSDSTPYCVKYISEAIKAKFKIGQMAFDYDPYNLVVATAPAQKGEVQAVANEEAIFLKMKELLKQVN